MACEHFAAYRAEVGSQSEITSFVKRFRRQSRPAAVNLAAAHLPAHHEHDIGMSMIGAAVAVLARRATEFGHGENYNIVHAVAEIAIESGETASQFSEPVSQLPGGAAFIGVGVPPADFGKGDFQAKIGLDQASDLCPGGH